ncbi:hypothetical protein ACQY0O_006662 [Thecaphora frezii]
MRVTQHQHNRSNGGDASQGSPISTAHVPTLRTYPSKLTNPSLFGPSVDPFSTGKAEETLPATLEDLGNGEDSLLNEDRQTCLVASPPEQPSSLEEGHGGDEEGQSDGGPGKEDRAARTCVTTSMPANVRRTTLTPHHPMRPLPSEAGPGPILVISGGSGYNDLVSATPGATYVMPISDNGGSSSEIIRVLGGPSIGDLRSRLNRLIPIPLRPHPSPFPSPEGYVPPRSNEALHALLSYRLPTTGPSRAIKQEWHDILEGRHRLWRGIEADRKEVIRGFLVHFESEVLRRAHRHFNFRGASIGNFFLAAAQRFFGSIQSGIFLFSATTQINAAQSGSKVVPVINTNHTATIAAELEGGEVIVGQCEISHPAPARAVGRGGERRQTGSGGAAESTREPGTPASAAFDAIARRGSGELDEAISRLTTGSKLRQGFSASDFAEAWGGERSEAESETDDHQLGTSYDSLSGSFIVEARGGAAARTVSAYRDRGRTTVGNTGDGLDPDEDESQDELAVEGEGGGNEGGAGEEHIERMGNVVFQKDDEAEGERALPSKIQRIFYVNAYRNEIYPAPNPTFLSGLERSCTLIYSCGSLWTSLIPCLSLRGVARQIATSPRLKYKILLLNTVQDRETRGMDAVAFLRAITESLNRNDVPGQMGRWTTKQLVTHLVYFEEGEVVLDLNEVQKQGVVPTAVQPSSRMSNGRPKFDETAIRNALERITAV